MARIFYQFLILMSILSKSFCTEDSSSSKKNMLTSKKKWNLKTMEIPELSGPENIRYVLDFMVHMRKIDEADSNQLVGQLNAELNFPKSENYFECPPKRENENTDDEEIPMANLILQILKGWNIKLEEEIRLDASMESYLKRIRNWLELRKILEEHLKPDQEKSNSFELEKKLLELDGIKANNIGQKYEKFHKFHKFAHEIWSNLLKMTEGYRELLENMLPFKDLKIYANGKEFFGEWQKGEDMNKIYSEHIGKMIESSAKLRAHLCHANAAYKANLLGLINNDADTLMQLEQKYPEILQIHQMSTTVQCNIYQNFLIAPSINDLEALKAKFHMMIALAFVRIEENIDRLKKITKINSKEFLLTNVLIAIIRHKLKYLKKIIFAKTWADVPIARSTFCQLYKFIRFFSKFKTPGLEGDENYKQIFQWKEDREECENEEKLLADEAFWMEAKMDFSKYHEQTMKVDLTSDFLTKLFGKEGKKTRFEEFIPGFKTNKEFAAYQPINLFSANTYITMCFMMGIEAPSEMNLLARRIALNYLAWQRLMLRQILANTSNKYVSNFKRVWNKKHLYFQSIYDEIFVKENVEEVEKFGEKLTKVNAGLKFLLDTNKTTQSVPIIEANFDQINEGTYVDWNSQMMSDNDNAVEIIESFERALNEENARWICKSLPANKKEDLTNALKTEKGRANLHFLVGLDNANVILKNFNLDIVPGQNANLSGNVEKEKVDEYDFGKNESSGQSHQSKKMPKNTGKSRKNKKGKKHQKWKGKSKVEKAIEGSEGSEEADGDHEGTDRVQEDRTDREQEDRTDREHDHGNSSRGEKEKIQGRVTGTDFSDWPKPLVVVENVGEGDPWEEVARKNKKKPTTEQHYRDGILQWHLKNWAESAAKSTKIGDNKSKTNLGLLSVDKQPSIWHASFAQKTPAELLKDSETSAGDDEKHSKEIEGLRELIDSIFEVNLEANMKKFHLNFYRGKWKEANLFKAGLNQMQLISKMKGFLNEINFLMERTNEENSGSHEKLGKGDDVDEQMERKEKKPEIGENIQAEVDLKKQDQKKGKGLVGQEELATHEQDILDNDLAEVLQNEIFGPLSYKDMTMRSINERNDKMREAILKLQKIIKTQWIPKFIKYFLITGSYMFNGHSSKSDIDGIILFPYFPERFDNNDIENLFNTLFFGGNSKCEDKKCDKNGQELTLFCTLCQEGAQSLRIVGSHVQLLKFHFMDVEFDLTFVPMSFPILEGIGNLKNLPVVDRLIYNYLKYHGTVIMERDSKVKDIRQGLLLALSGLRASLRIDELLIENHQREKFRLVMLTLKFWAINHHIYSGQFGFFNGTMLAVMACQVIIKKENQEASFLEILHRFFKEYAEWNGITQEIGLSLVESESLHVQNPRHLDMMEKGFWQSEKERDQRKEFFSRFYYLKEDTDLIWVVLTPGFPQQNAAFNVNFSNAQIMRKELRNGLTEFEPVKNIQPAGSAAAIKRAFKKWIYNSKGFEQKYGHFLVIGCQFGPNAGENGPKFCENVESRIRLQLLFSLGKIGQELQLLFHANPEKVANGQERCAESKYGKMFKGEEDWHCVIWLVGIGKRDFVGGEISHKIIEGLNASIDHFTTRIFKQPVESHYKLETLVKSIGQLLANIGN